MGNDSRKSPAKVVPLGSKRQEREVVVNSDTGEVIDFSLSDKDKPTFRMPLHHTDIFGLIFQ